MRLPDKPRVLLCFAVLSCTLFATACGRVNFSPVLSSRDGQVGDSQVDASADSSVTDASELRPGCMLFCEGELATLPAAGAAWDAMLAIADGNLGTADLSALENEHPANVLALALVATRLDDDARRARVADQVLSIMGTEAGGSVQTVARHLPAYVFSADLVGLESLRPSEDATFRTWLADIRSRDIIGHPRWTNITFAHGDSGNDWGSKSGLSRIAASLYVRDLDDVDAAAEIFYGYVGDRARYTGFETSTAFAPQWTCDEATWTPLNPACVRSGVNVDGALVDHLDETTPLSFPVSDERLGSTEESLRPLYLQAWLLTRAGYADPFGASDDALLRAYDFMLRAGWDEPYSTSHMLPWFVDAIYGTNYASVPAGKSRTFGFTDWLAPLLKR